MSQLVIIDVQQTFEGSQFLDDQILEYSKQFDSTVYIYDVISGDGIFPYDMWTEMAIEHEEGSFNPRVISKEYGFFRNLMDHGVDEDCIIALGQTMLKYGIRDARDIKDSEHVDKFKKILDQYDTSIDFEDYLMYLPDLMEDLSENISSGAILVGGGYDECLREVSLLLSILDIDHTVSSSYTY